MKTFARPKLLDSFLTGLTVFGGIVGLLTLYPRVTITTSVDVKEPLSSSFLVSNDGALPVYSVTITCLLGEIAGRQGEVAPRLEKFGSGLQPTFIPVVTLSPGEKELIPFSNCYQIDRNGSLAGAHVGLQVTYRPLLFPIERSLTQEFYAQDYGRGVYVWYSVPYAK
jgi:hypothetical protein